MLKDGESKNGSNLKNDIYGPEYLLTGAFERLSINKEVISFLFLS